MTKKQALQKELQERVIPGVKPSDLKKLKRSKSADDISLVPITKIKQLEDEISILALKLETSERELIQKDTTFNSQLQQINCLFDPNAINYTQPINFTGLYQHLKEILTNSPPQPLLLDQLKEKQSEIENLRKQLESTNQKLTETTAELDNSLQIRHQNLKDFANQQEAIKALNQELNETIDQASEEIITSDSEISQLKRKINQLKTAKENLEKDLKLERIKKGTHPNPINSADNFLQYSFYALLALAFLVSILAQEK